MRFFKRKSPKIADSEVRRVLASLTSIQGAPSFRGNPGDKVRIINGPFEGMEGTIVELIHERSMVRLTVNIYGRETPVEQHYSWIERA